MLYYGPQQVIPSPQGSPANGNSMAANIISSPTVIQQLYACSYAVVWSGTSPVGTISVQGSLDFSQYADGSVHNPGTWNTLTINYLGAPAQSVPVSGNTGNGLIDLVQTGIYAVRLVYTATSGTGSLTATMFGKSVGG